VTAALLNEQMRDNLDAVKNPPTALTNVNEAANYSTTSTTFVDVDNVDLSLSITTGGGDVLIGLCTSVLSGNGFGVGFDVTMDGIRILGDDGLVQNNNGGDVEIISFAIMRRSVSAGLHTFRLQWRSQTGVAVTMYAGAGTANLDAHPQFWVREVS
jgi:hypothetical protein